VPVEYAVAVDRYLAGASLGAASRRVYRISLTS
jgi:integrase/recombinase XerD